MLSFFSSRSAVVTIAGMTFVAVFCVLRHGMPMSPDGWIYWQGSVGILEGRGYVDLAGNPVRYWPPGYSAYLALCQWFVGVSGMALVISTALASALAVGAWAWCARRYAALRGASAASASLATLFCALVIVVHCRDLRSETLMRVLLPLGLGLALVLRSRQKDLGGILCLLVICLSAMTVVRNAAVGLVPAVVFVVVGFDSRRSLRNRVGIGAALVIVPVLIWGSVQALFCQLGATEIGLGVSRYSWFEYGIQLLRSLGRGVSVEGLGQVLLCVTGFTLVRRDRELSQGDGRSLLGCAVIGLVSTYVLFNLSWVEDELGGRFILFASLILGSVGLVDSSQLLRGRLFVVLAVAMLSFPLVKASRYLITGQRPRDPVFTQAQHEQCVPWNGTIDAAHRNGPVIEREGRLILPPPAYPWLPLPGPGRKK